jgi:hypothetical protein
VAKGRDVRVLDYRAEFQVAMREDAIAKIEELTGRKVAAFMSANHIDPDLAAELFVLEPDGDAGPERRRVIDASRQAIEAGRQPYSEGAAELSASVSNQTRVLPSWTPQRLVRASTTRSPRPPKSSAARAPISCTNPAPWSITSPWTV